MVGVVCCFGGIIDFLLLVLMGATELLLDTGAPVRLVLLVVCKRDVGLLCGVAATGGETMDFLLCASEGGGGEADTMDFRRCNEAVAGSAGAAIDFLRCCSVGCGGGGATIDFLRCCKGTAVGAMDFLLAGGGVGEEGDDGATIDFL